jgi:hypothetical protein
MCEEVPVVIAGYRDKHYSGFVPYTDILQLSAAGYKNLYFVLNPNEKSFIESEYVLFSGSDCESDKDRIAAFAKQQGMNVEFVYSDVAITDKQKLELFLKHASQNIAGILFFNHNNPVDESCAEMMKNLDIPCVYSELGLSLTNSRWLVMGMAGLISNAFEISKIAPDKQTVTRMQALLDRFSDLEEELKEVEEQFKYYHRYVWAEHAEQSVWYWWYRYQYEDAKNSGTAIEACFPVIIKELYSIYIEKFPAKDSQIVTKADTPELLKENLPLSETKYYHYDKDSRTPVSQQSLLNILEKNTKSLGIVLSHKITFMPTDSNDIVDETIESLQMEGLKESLIAASAANYDPIVAVLPDRIKSIFIHRFCLTKEQVAKIVHDLHSKIKKSGDANQFIKYCQQEFSILSSVQPVTPEYFLKLWQQNNQLLTREAIAKNLRSEVPIDVDSEVKTAFNKLIADEHKKYLQASLKVKLYKAFTSDLVEVKSFSERHQSIIGQLNKVPPASGIKEIKKRLDVLHANQDISNPEKVVREFMLCHRLYEHSGRRLKDPLRNILQNDFHYKSNDNYLEFKYFMLMPKSLRNYWISISKIEESTIQYINTLDKKQGERLMKAIGFTPKRSSHTPSHLMEYAFRAHELLQQDQFAFISSNTKLTIKSHLPLIKLLSSFYESTISIDELQESLAKMVTFESMKFDLYRFPVK